MTGDIEGIAAGLGDVGTGAGVAAAIERERGADGGSAGHTHERACLNCGAALLGPHCHSCGQRAHVHRTLGAFFHDLLHGVLHFEGKTWRTLPLLVWQPGRLTREYIDGRRARYVSPIALFLFVVFLSFALFSALGGGDGATAVDLKDARASYEANRATITELERERAEAVPTERAEIDERLTAIKREQQALRQVLGSIESEFIEGFTEDPLPKDSALTRAIDDVRANPQLAIYKAQTSAYKYSWLLIPLSVPFVWLLFPFSRRFKGYDHTVFVTYSIAFMIALVAAASVLIYLNAQMFGLLLLLYAPFHMYRQLRGTYALSRFGAIWRMLALSAFAWVAIGLFVGVISLLAAN